MAVTKGGADPLLCPYVDRESLPAGIGKSDGNGLEQVARSQDERDIALVTHLKTKIRGKGFAEIASCLGARWEAAQPELLRFRYLGREVELTRDEASNTLNE